MQNTSTFGKNATRQYSEKKAQEQSSQSHYNSHFNLKKQTYAQYEAALQKEQRIPRATL